MEEVLENWEPYHAIREIISNALDEQLMSDTDEILIEESDSKDGWHIRDFGRGIKIEHFTQNENPEKFQGPSGIIGKFGVGLKDALATFYRNEIYPVISSKHGTFKISMHPKEGFAEIETLHVIYEDSKKDMIGTDFFLKGATKEQVDKAKDLFLKFSDIKTLEETKYGSVLESHDEEKPSRVYINGVLASEEENFLFSYNITDLTEKMRKALNRERTNVGRTTYTGRIKSILKSANSDAVLSELSDQIKIRESGLQCDEIRWAEVAQIGINALADRDDRVIYVTNENILNNPDFLGDMQRDGYTIITVSESDRSRISGENVNTFDDYVRDSQISFEFTFVEEEELTKQEMRIFSKANQILDLVGWVEDRPSVRISETMRPESDSRNGVLVLHDAVGCYSLLSGIIIKRSQLESLDLFASTLLHEAAHASSGATDATRDFENELTEYLGSTAEAALTD